MSLTTSGLDTCATLSFARTQKLNIGYSNRLIRMCANEEIEKKIKKIRIFNELLIAIGKNKIIFKGMDDKKHYTLKVMKEKILDFHETVEGKEKKYAQIAKFDPKNLSEVIVNTLREELPNILKEIDTEDPKHAKAGVLVIPEGESLWEHIKKMGQIQRKEMKIEKEKSEDVMKDLVVPMKDLQNYNFKIAYSLKEGEELGGLLYRINGRYFLVELDDFEMLMNKMANKIFEKSKILRN